MRFPKGCFKLFALSFLVLFVLIDSISTYGQEKVIEKSGKTPSWINSTQKDFIIESGKGVSIDEARNRALSNVKESIVKSVAEKISSTSEDKTIQERQGNSYKISGNYQSIIHSKTADLPFIKGISLNKVSDYYWEKLKDKKSGTIGYYYYLKYPFSDFELQSIILDYEMSQKKITEGLNDASEGIDDISKIEQVLEKIQTLRGIIPQLDESDKAVASMNIVKLESILKSITIEEVINQKGVIKYFLAYNARHFTTSLKPKILSNCASNFRNVQIGDTILLNYDPSDCFAVVSNTISIEYIIGNYSVKNSFPLILNQSSVELSISDGIQLKSADKDTLTINNYQLLLPILLKTKDEILLKSVVLEFPGLPFIPFNGLSNVILHNGINDVLLNGQVSLKRKSYYFSAGKSILVSGSLIYVVSKTGETGTYKFFNERIILNW